MKQRTRNGNFGVKNKRYVDENGLNWNGKTCGSCNLDRVRNAMKELRDRRTASAPMLQEMPQTESK